MVQTMMSNNQKAAGKIHQSYQWPLFLPKCTSQKDAGLNSTGYKSKCFQHLDDKLCQFFSLISSSDTITLACKTDPLICSHLRTLMLTNVVSTK